jgi:ADP-heptose:LPS heptosyltransferase
VVALGGPAEEARAMDLPHDVAVRGAPLDRIAAVLARAPRYLGNDSGISHLAALVGGRGVAVFGPTDPVAWRPRGDGIGVLYAPQGCRRCGAERFCVHRLSVADVLASLRAIGRR